MSFLNDFRTYYRSMRVDYGLTGIDRITAAFLGVNADTAVKKEKFENYLELIKRPEKIVQKSKTSPFT